MLTLRTVGKCLPQVRSGATQCRQTPLSFIYTPKARAAYSIWKPSQPGYNSSPHRSYNFSQAHRLKQSASIAKVQRGFSTSPKANHGHIEPPKPGEEIKVTFIDKEGDEHTFEVSKGTNLLDLAQDNDLEMEGACGGSCACSTCHIIVEDEQLYDKMPEPDDDENDMLDLAFGLTETSRLGCQVVMTKELDGLRVRLPSMTRNLQASDFSKKE